MFVAIVGFEIANSTLLVMKKLFYLLISLLMISLTGCKDHYSENIIDLDVFEEVELSSQTSDVNVTSVKCAIPMDEILRMIGYDDYIFMLGTHRNQIYCVQGDSVISILDAAGRGHGEYSIINDFTFDEKQNILYVNADQKIMKYDIPTMSFLGAVDISFTTSSMIALNSDEMLVNCSFIEDDSNSKVYRGICKVSLTDGSILNKYYELDYFNNFCFISNDFSKSGSEYLLSLGGAFVNKVVSLNIEDGSVKELDSFSFSEKWRLSKNAIKQLKRNESDFKSYFWDNCPQYCRGCHYPAIINNRLTYWFFPEDNEVGREIAVIKDGERTICKYFRIPGTNITVNPYFVKGNCCVYVIQGTAKSIIDNSRELSDLGKEIYNAMSNQSVNNPVLLSFTIDKGL